MFRPKSKRRSAKLKRKLRVESLERRNLLAANPIGMTEFDTGEFMLGNVGVTAVFFESNGQIDRETQDWVAADINATIAKISEGVSWWSDTLDTLGSVHELDFTFDFTYAHNPVETPYELIDRKSQDVDLAIAGWIGSLGYDASRSVQTAVQQFNHDQRIKLETDWAFTIFVVDSSDDPSLGDEIEDPDDPDDNEGYFPAGGYFRGAFAYAGGLFFVTPSSRPASTFTHEMGHIFWTRDEYPGGGSWHDQRGYYNTQNTNAADDSPFGHEQEISIMRSGIPLGQAYDQHVSPAATLAMLGWQDSDGNGIFDLADVPLELNGVGYFDNASSIYHFSGSASAVPLLNQNSFGPQSDITLNRISELQYRLDGGDWVAAAAPDSARADFDLQFAIEIPFDLIEWRVIDSKVGVTSELMTGTAMLPAISASRVAGYAYLDKNNNQIRDANEPLLPGLTATIEYADGRAVTLSSVFAAELPKGKINPQRTTGVQLSTDSFGLDRVLYAEPSPLAGGGSLFQAYSFQHSNLREHWNAEMKFKASFDEPVGYVEVSLVAGSSPSYGRIEAYDADGNLIGRQTSDKIQFGVPNVLRFQDPTAQIASVKVFGHAGSSVGISGLDFGTTNQVTSDDSGTWQFGQLADGDYRIALTTSDDSLMLSAVDRSAISNNVWQTLSVGDPLQPLIAIPVRRKIDSWHNSKIPGDVNGDNKITASDALVVINYLSEVGVKRLSGIAPEKELVDVNGDGSVTALDALLVINILSERVANVAGTGVIAEQTGATEANPATQETQNSSSGRINIIPLSQQISDNPGGIKKMATDQAFANWPERVESPAPYTLPILSSSARTNHRTSHHSLKNYKNLSQKMVVDYGLRSTIETDLIHNDSLTVEVRQ